VLLVLTKSVGWTSHTLLGNAAFGNDPHATPTRLDLPEGGEESGGMKLRNVTKRAKCTVGYADHAVLSGRKKQHYCVCIWKGRVLALAVLPTKFGKSLLLLCTTSLWLLARKRRQVFFNVAGMLAAPIRSDSILIIAFILHIGHMIKETTMRTDLQARCPWQSQVNHKSNIKPFFADHRYHSTAVQTL